MLIDCDESKLIETQTTVRGCVGLIADRNVYQGGSDDQVSMECARQRFGKQAPCSPAGTRTQGMQVGIEQ